MTKVCIFNKSNDNWKIVQLSADTLCVRPPKSCTTLTLTLTLTPLTLQNENPHTGYPCHGNIHTKFDFSTPSFLAVVRSPCSSDRRTDGRVSPVMWPIRTAAEKLTLLFRIWQTDKRFSSTVCPHAGKYYIDGPYSADAGWPAVSRQPRPYGTVSDLYNELGEL